MGDTDTPIRVLMVEDNPGDARLVELELDMAVPGGFAVTRVERLATAAEALREASFDIALLDMSLPDSQGIGTVDKLLGHAPDLPVIALSGYDDPAFGAEVVERGARTYLVKGRDGGDIIAKTIHEVLGKG